MVFYRRRRRTYAKRRFPVKKTIVKRRRYTPTRRRIPSPMSKIRMGGFANTKTCTLRYMSSVNALNPGAGGTSASHVYTGNGLYDPDITSTGHQPLGFDEWMNAYNHYTVTGFRMSVTFFNTDATNPAFVGIKVTADGAAITNGQETLEQGNCRWRLLGPTSGSGSKSMAKIVINYDNSRYFSRDVLSERDYQGTISGNPLEQLYPTIFAFPNSSTDIAIVNAHVIIDYKVVFSEPKLVNQS